MFEAFALERGRVFRAAEREFAHGAVQVDVDNLPGSVALDQAIRSGPWTDWVPRVKSFAGKGAASYHQAKLIIKLTNDIARTVNNDPTVRGLLKVVFLPN